MAFILLLAILICPPHSAMKYTPSKEETTWNINVLGWEVALTGCLSPGPCEITQWDATQLWHMRTAGSGEQSRSPFRVSCPAGMHGPGNLPACFTHSQAVLLLLVWDLHSESPSGSCIPCSKHKVSHGLVGKTGNDTTLEKRNRRSSGPGPGGVLRPDIAKHSPSKGCHKGTDPDQMGLIKVLADAVERMDR